MFTFHAEKILNYTGAPLSTVYVPVMDSLAEDRKTVAILSAVLRWESYFEDILTDSTEPVHVVLSNSCDGAFTYEIRGASAMLLGKGNLANPKYYDMMISVDFDESNDYDFIVEPNTIALTLNQDLCRYNLRIYPTQEGENNHTDFFLHDRSCLLPL